MMRSGVMGMDSSVMMEAERSDWSSFDAEYESAKQTFDDQVKMSLNMTYAWMGESTDKQALYVFDEAYESATGELDKKMQQAKDEYRMRMEQGVSRDEARNKFIDTYGNNNAWYFHELEKAKNHMARDMDVMGQAQYKDRFMDRYNMYKDDYGTKLEAFKNDW